MYKENALRLTFDELSLEDLIKIEKLQLKKSKEGSISLNDFETVKISKIIYDKACKKYNKEITESDEIMLCPANSDLELSTNRRIL